jgi:hypothetical protein
MDFKASLCNNKLSLLKSYCIDLSLSFVVMEVIVKPLLSEVILLNLFIAVLIKLFNKVKMVINSVINRL